MSVKAAFLGAGFLKLGIAFDTASTPVNAEKRCRMAVMSASVHDAVYNRLKRDIGFFLNRQCIKIGAQGNGFSRFSATQRSDDTASPYTCANLAVVPSDDRAHLVPVPPEAW